MVDEMEARFETPEAAALSGWTAEWQPRVIDVRYRSTTDAAVLVDTTPSHPMLVTCWLDERGWRDVADQDYDDHFPSDWQP